MSVCGAQMEFIDLVMNKQQVTFLTSSFCLRFASNIFSSMMTAPPKLAALSSASADKIGSTVWVSLLMLAEMKTLTALATDCGSSISISLKSLSAVTMTLGGVGRT